MSPIGGGSTGAPRLPHQGWRQLDAAADQGHLPSPQRDRSAEARKRRPGHLLGAEPQQPLARVATKVVGQGPSSPSAASGSDASRSASPALGQSRPQHVASGDLRPRSAGDATNPQVLDDQGMAPWRREEQGRPACVGRRANVATGFPRGARAGSGPSQERGQERPGEHDHPDAVHSPYSPTGVTELATV